MTVTAKTCIILAATLLQDAVQIGFASPAVVVPPPDGKGHAAGGEAPLDKLSEARHGKEDLISLLTIVRKGQKSIIIRSVSTKGDATVPQQQPISSVSNAVLLAT